MSNADSYTAAIEVLEALSTAVKAVRLSRAISLRSVAAETGVSFSTVTRIESGEDCTVGSALALLRWMAAPPSVPAQSVVDLDADCDDEPAALLWTCDECGKRATWSHGWTWFGSYHQLDRTGKPEAVLCSKECREANAAKASRDAAVIE